jgi:hypothetical protein
MPGALALARAHNPLLSSLTSIVSNALRARSTGLLPVDSSGWLVRENLSTRDALHLQPDSNRSRSANRRPIQVKDFRFLCLEASRSYVGPQNLCDHSNIGHRLLASADLACYPVVKQLAGKVRRPSTESLADPGTASRLFETRANRDPGLFFRLHANASRQATIGTAPTGPHQTGSGASRLEPSRPDQTCSAGRERRC